jgi:small-conductance mechanosensitive channel
MVTQMAADAARPVIEETIRDAARDAARRAVFLIFALILFACVMIFAELSFYLWLRTEMAAHFAALIVAGTALVLMAIALLITFSGGAKSSARVQPQPAAVRASAAETATASEPPANGTGTAGDTGGDAGGRATGDPMANLAADAEALGKMLGKDASGYQLVLGAFLVGMLLGRDK